MAPDLHDRVAAALGWTVKAAQSLPLAALRDLLRPEHPELVAELSAVIQSGSHIVEPPRPRRRRR